MALTLKILGIGQLTGTTEQTIVAGSTNKGSLVQNINLTNTGASTITVSGIWVKVADPATPGSFVKRLVTPQNFTIAPHAQVIFENDVTLGASFFSTGVSTPDTLVSKLGATGTVDYVVCGMERDV
jgi:hypothetical protein